MHTRHTLRTGLVVALSLGGGWSVAPAQESVTMAPMRMLTPMESMTRAIETDPGNAELYRKRAAMHSGVLEFESAHDDLTTALRLDPSFHEARYARAMVRRDLGRYAEALEDIRALEDAQVAFMHRVLELRATVHIAERDWSLARRALERVIGLYPESGRGYWLRARVRLASGDEEGGADDLARAWELDYDAPVWGELPPVTALERRVIASDGRRGREASEESADDVRIRAWVDQGTESSIERLYAYASDPASPEQHEPGARGLVAWAQRCAHEGRDAEAARAALEVCRGTAPDHLRLMALMVYLRTAPGEDGAEQLALIESGAQDERFAWALPELRALHAIRAASE
ncbi:MAG: hypothetical protein Tsb0013_22930 [Phycisphaerales bacterium]